MHLSPQSSRQSRWAESEPWQAGEQHLPATTRAVHQVGAVVVLGAYGRHSAFGLASSLSLASMACTEAELSFWNA
jgi:hypothetical protein